MKKKLTPAYPSLKMCHKKLSTALGNKLLWLMKTRKANIKRSEFSLILNTLGYYHLLIINLSKTKKTIL